MVFSFWKWKIHSLPLQIFRMPWSSRQNCANIGQTLAAGMPFYGWYAVKHLDVTNNVDNLCVPMARVNGRVATVASAPSVGMGRRSLVNRMWVGCIPYTVLKCIYVHTDYINSSYLNWCNMFFLINCMFISSCSFLLQPLPLLLETRWSTLTSPIDPIRTEFVQLSGHFSWTDGI